MDIKNILTQSLEYKFASKKRQEIRQVRVDWNDLKSIKASEKQKLKLENEGYTLVQTIGGLTTSTLIYRLD